MSETDIPNLRSKSIELSRDDSSVFVSDATESLLERGIVQLFAPDGGFPLPTVTFDRWLLLPITN